MSTKNEQFRDTGTIGHKTQKGVNPGAHEGQAVPTSYKTLCYYFWLCVITSLRNKAFYPF